MSTVVATKSKIALFLAKHFPALNPFHRPTLDEIIAQECEIALEEHRQAEHTIRTQKYLAHMANAKLDAMEAWRRLDKDRTISVEMFKCL